VPSVPGIFQAEQQGKRFGQHLMKHCLALPCVALRCVAVSCAFAPPMPLPCALCLAPYIVVVSTMAPSTLVSCVTIPCVTLPCVRSCLVSLYPCVNIPWVTNPPLCPSFVPPVQLRTLVVVGTMAPVPCAVVPCTHVPCVTIPVSLYPLCPSLFLPVQPRTSWWWAPWPPWSSIPPLPTSRCTAAACPGPQVRKPVL